MVYPMRSLVTYSLIFSFIFLGIHIDDHPHERYDGYSICSIGCNEVSHHENHHQCEICIHNKSTTFFKVSCSEIIFDDDNYYHHLSLRLDYQKLLFLNSTLLSRPPPKLL